MKRKGGLVILLALLLVTGCSREETITLKDGRTIRTWATTYGTNHVAPGQFIPWLDKRLPSFPRRMLRALSTHAAAQLQEIATETPRLVLWTHPISDPTNTAMIPVVRLTFPGQVDSAGSLVFYDGGWGGGRDRTPGAAALSQFRRRDPVVTVEAQVVEPGTQDWPSPSTTLHLRNPKPFTGPSWKPDSMPVSRTQSGIHATLYDLAVTNRFVTNKAGRRLAFQQTLLRFDALDDSRTPLRVLSCTLSDPGGNRLNFILGKALEKSVIHPLGGSLFDDEPAWRLELETDLPGSNPAVTVERVEFTGLTDPADDDETGSQPRATPIRRTGRLVPNLEIPVFQWRAGRAPTLQIGLRRCPPGIRVELEKVTDELGRIWTARENSSAGYPGSESFHEYLMSATNGAGISARSMNLTFRIFRTAIFEFHPPAKFSSVPPLP